MARVFREEGTVRSRFLGRRSPHATRRQISVLMVIKGNESSGAEVVPLSWLAEIAEVIYK
jgi:hypothetical protein